MELTIEKATVADANNLFLPLPQQKDRFVKYIKLIPYAASASWYAVLVQSETTPTGFTSVPAIAHFSAYKPTEVIFEGIQCKNLWICLNNTTGAALSVAGVVGLSNSLKGRYVVD